MNKYLCLFLVFLLTAPVALFGQGITVSGKVTSSEDGSPLPGVNIVVAGTATGAITDVEGMYSITVPGPDASLTFSYIGFLSETIAVGNQTTLDINLTPDLLSLDEVVVTALGINREKKSLGYAVQEVNGKSLVEARDNNIANSLSGKVAGLQISRAGTGSMGSSRITIRGNSSLSGNNQPLIVIDGVPVNNFTGDANDRWGNRVLDYGTGLSDINPDDVESVSVLKGPAAAALYGSRAGAGVIMVTTKKGSLNKGIGVTLNSNTVFEQATSYLDLQNEYGQGANGAFDPTLGGSWGAKMEGQNVTDYTGQTRPFSAYGNDITKDFLQTGIASTNSVELNTGNEMATFRAAISQLNSKGIIPNSQLDKTNVILRSSANLSSKLSVDAKVNYIRTEGKNRPKIAQDPDNIFLNYLITPRSIHYADLENYENPDGSPFRWDNNNGGMILNPYWTINKNTNNDVQDRFIGMASVQYKLTSDLNVLVRHGIDYRNGDTYNRLGTGVPYWFPSGDLLMQKFYSSENTTEGFINYSNKALAQGKISISLMVGAAATKSVSKTAIMQSNGLLVKDFFSMSVAAQPSLSNGEYSSATHSVFGSAQLGYDNWLYLDITGRNDWSSTLQSSNWSYFYPSIGLGWVVSDMFKSFGSELPSFISFAKLRGSYAEVGNGTSPYAIQLTYGIPQFGGGLSGATPPTTLPLFDLKPELAKSIELGADLRFANNRIGIDFTYFKKNTTNQIISLDVPAATGYVRKLINAGNIGNKGVEIVLNLTPVKTNDLQWDIAFNFTKIKNEIIELTDETKQQTLGSGQVSIIAVEGSNYGDIYGSSYLRDLNGNIVIDSLGLPMFTATPSKIGNFQADWIGGISNTITYKSVSLNFLFDIHKGGDLYAGSIVAAANAGTYAKTAEFRDGGLIIEGVHEDGTPNTTSVTSQNYWTSVTRINEAFIRDGSYVRLRELSLGYSIPQNLLSNTFIKSLKISFVGRNLLLFNSSMEGLDPESTYTTGNAQGLELGSTPSTRTLGFNINIGL